MANVIENLELAPTPPWEEPDPTEQALLDTFAAQWTKDRERWAEYHQMNVDRLAAGSFSLHWMNTEGSNWGTAIQKSPRGLTYDDINRPRCYGTIPEVSEYRNMTPRGSVREPYRDRLPDYPEFKLIEKWDVWADNVCSLYEEAKFRQWNATKDIPWHELEQASEDLEKAACQLATFLTEIEFAAGDFPAKWVARIPNDFFEIKSFLASQIMDEARHVEVFRKRAICNGGSLLHVTPHFEWAGKALLDTPSHTLGSFFLNLLGEGMILSLFRAGEFLARTHVDREIFRLCLQDEARHVAFGTIEMKNYLENHPDPVAAQRMLHQYADMVEPTLEAMLLEPQVLEPLAVLMAGNVEDIDTGMEGVSFLWGVIREEYLQRCDRAGFDRRETCVLYEDLPWKVA